MEETAKENGNLLNQAKERAKSLIEGYVKNVGETNRKRIYRRVG